MDSLERITLCDLNTQTFECFKRTLCWFYKLNSAQPAMRKWIITLPDTYKEKALSTSNSIITELYTFGNEKVGISVSSQIMKATCDRLTPLYHYKIKTKSNANDR